MENASAQIRINVLIDNEEKLLFFLDIPSIQKVLTTTNQIKEKLLTHSFEHCDFWSKNYVNLIYISDLDEKSIISASSTGFFIHNSYRIYVRRESK